MVAVTVVAAAVAAAVAHSAASVPLVFSAHLSASLQVAALAALSLLRKLK